METSQHSGDQWGEKPSVSGNGSFYVVRFGSCGGSEKLTGALMFIHFFAVPEVLFTISESGQSWFTVEGTIQFWCSVLSLLLLIYIHQLTFLVNLYSNCRLQITSTAISQ